MWSCALASNAAYLSEEPRLGEVGDPLWGCLAFGQAELHLQHSMREASDVCARNWLVGIPVPPGPHIGFQQKTKAMMTQR